MELGGIARPMEMRPRPPTLRVGIAGRPSGLDDVQAMDRAARLVTSTIYETPCQDLADTGVIEATLFRGPLRRVDAYTWEGTLRAPLRLSNGDPVFVRDVARVLRRASSMRGVRIATFEEGLRFETHQPEELFMHRLTHPSTRLAFRRSEGLLGTGPYQLIHRARERVLLAPNPYWTAHHLGLDGSEPRPIEFIVYPRDASGRARALVEAFNDRAIDFTVDLGREDVIEVEVGARTSRPGCGTCVLALNTESVFRSVALRRATAMAIDRLALARLCFREPEPYVARSLLPPSVFKAGASAAPSVTRTRIVAAGLVPERPLRLVRPLAPSAALPAPERVARALLDQLADIGLSVADTPVADERALERRLLDGDYDLALGTWGAEVDDPHAFMHGLLHSSSVPSRDSHALRPAVNAARLRDAEFDGLLERVHRDASAANIAAALAWVGDQCPVVPLLYGRTYAVHAPSLLEVEWGSGGFPDLTTAHFDD